MAVAVVCSYPVSRLDSLISGKYREIPYNLASLADLLPTNLPESGYFKGPAKKYTKNNREISGNSFLLMYHRNRRDYTIYDLEKN